MDIWLIAVLVAWLPVATALALLVGGTVVRADRRERVLHRRRPGAHAPVVDITTARHHHDRHHAPHRSSSHHRDHVAS
ncbi:hypothetical protein [Streptomyces sp. NP160]|uniref:hypothetical protein n=1 Tax=Streptomyces sp. NP160 TaxID=2586637 RepID=UPI001C59EDB7|nr:hypothetical protein [Streptomyces sp. NP160]